MEKRKVYDCLVIIVIIISTIASIAFFNNDNRSAHVLPFIIPRDIIINPHNKNELYAIFAKHGFYRSTDKGETWIYFGTINDVEFIGLTAFDPVEKTIYAGTPNGLFKSYDFNNWEKLGEFNSIQGIFVQPADKSGIIYVTTGWGLYVSTDGHIWEKVNVPTSYSHVGLYPVAIDPSDPSIIYFAMVRPNDILIDDGWEGSGIYKSKDQGKTLEKILSTRKSILLISSSNANIMYGMDENKLLKSVDGGASWKIVSTLEYIFVEKLVVNPADHNILYAITIDYSNSSGGKMLLLKSIDGGKTWQDISSDSPFDNSNAVTHIVVDPLNPDILYAGASKGGIYKSTDAGKTWKASNNGINISKDVKE